MNSARAFLAGIIDYAGLFPPASLDMASAVGAYADYKAGDHRDLLGRFVLPASRIAEFASASQHALSTSGNPWLLSVIASDDIDSTREAVLEFNARGGSAADHQRAFCDTVETPVKSTDDIERVATVLGSSFNLFLEIPLGGDPRKLIAAVAGVDACAKMRTGGTTPASIPASADIVHFMTACADAGVPFKATAGLHHPIRGSYRLTYEPDSPVGIMHGYLNVFFAAAFCARHEIDNALAVMNETDASTFRFDEQVAVWRTKRLDHELIDHVRKCVALSFGSCSFTEPIRDAEELGLL
jgi:hypothetical protein